MKLTEYINQDSNYKNTFHFQAEMLFDVLKDFHIFDKMFDRLSKHNLDDLYNFNPFEKDKGSTYYDLARIIDAVFHKDNIVVRSFLFNAAVISIEEAFHEMARKRFVTEKMMAKMPEIMSKIEKMQEERKNASNN